MTTPTISELDYDENRLADVLTWSVIPALPGTRIEWQADWCKQRSLPVHAWLIQIDVIARRHKWDTDTSCVKGFPMVLNAHGELQRASEADLEGQPGEIIEGTR